MNVAASSSQGKVVLDFIAAFEKLEWEKMSTLFDDHIIMYVTNGRGGTDKIEGRDLLRQRFQSVDYSKADLINLIPTQLISIEKDKIMVMVQVKANKKGVDFQNFAAFLCYIKDNKLTHIWMVDAQPAYSDQFWRS